MSNQGRVVWHDLMTTEPETSVKFFTELFGWQVREVDMGPAGSYRMISSGGTDIGGFVALDKTHGAPSHWIAYVAVDDVEAACERATSIEGEVVVEGTDIPDVGRFAVIKDPTGGFISPLKSARAYPEETSDPTPAGRFVWEELLTNDVEKARSFYGELFGWGTKEMDMGEAGPYTVFTSGGKDRAGMMKMPEGVPHPPHWLSYVAVDDVDAVAERVTELGGTVFKAPDFIPGVGRFAVAGDPSGAVFAFYKGAGS